MSLNEKTNRVIEQLSRTMQPTVCFIQILYISGQTHVIPAPNKPSHIKTGRGFTNSEVEQYRVITLSKNNAAKNSDSIFIRTKLFIRNGDNFKWFSNSQHNILTPSEWCQLRRWPINICSYLSPLGPEIKSIQGEIRNAYSTPGLPAPARKRKPKFIVDNSINIKPKQVALPAPAKSVIPDKVINDIQVINGRKQPQFTKTQIILKTGTRTIKDYPLASFMKTHHPAFDDTVFALREISFTPYYSYHRQCFAWTMNVVYYKIIKGQPCEYRNINVKIPIPANTSINDAPAPPDTYLQYLPNVRIPKKRD